MQFYINRVSLPAIGDIPGIFRRSFANPADFLEPHGAQCFLTGFKFVGRYQKIFIPGVSVIRLWIQIAADQPFDSQGVQAKIFEITKDSEEFFGFDGLYGNGFFCF